MKTKKIFIFALLLIFALSTVLSGCSSSMFGNNDGKTPQEIIEDVYGNQQFKISFQSEGLEKPLEDMMYSAQSMPVLPTPERVGYIFEGWYLDKSYTIPYSDGILYLYMKDVTMYAKWSEEEFVQDGTYDIEFEAHILEDTVEKGSLTDTYGGYKNWTEDIVVEETYIEKTEEGLLLQIRYDGGIVEPYGAASPVYGVSVSSMTTDSSVYITDKIDSYTDSLKTIYLNVTDFDLTQPIYLRITTTNWETEGLNDEERYETTTVYVAEFNIERIIGFSRPFVNPDIELEDGYYSVQTYLKGADNQDNMGSSFNPTYSYIYAENGNYTLIKPTYPYAGLVEYQMGSLLDPYTANYFYRMMTFMPMQVCFNIDSSAYGSETVESDYYPETYNAGYYKEYAVEFHADTGRFYGIFDLGSDLKQEFMVSSAVTGFMEVAGGMGGFNQILTIDYDHMIKLGSVDYEPLTGDNYSYEEQIQYYPGSPTDLEDRGLIYDATEAYGLSTKMINFFFTSAGLNTAYPSRKLYSSRITVTPTAETNTQKVSDSRYSIAHFDVNSKIYGYDVKSSLANGQNLYADSMTLTAFEGKGMRESVEIRTGKSLEKGETVLLSELYAEKANNDVPFSSVNWQAYKMKGGEPDFSASVTLGSSFVFDEEIAILFTAQIDGETSSTLVELVLQSEPKITIKDSVYQWKISDTDKDKYVTDTVTTVGERVVFPDVSFIWGYSSGDFKDDYYSTEMVSGEIGMNPMKVGYYGVSNGIYRLSYAEGTSLEFTMQENSTLAVYELTNLYGERYYVYFEYQSQARESYTVTDSEDDNGTVYGEGEIKWDEDGIAKAISVNIYDYLTDDNLSEALTREYYYHSGNTVRKFSVSSYSIYTDTEKAVDMEFTGIEEMLTDIEERTKASGYAQIVIEYRSGSDIVTAIYLYRVTFRGSNTYEAMSHEDYFTGYEYSFVMPYIYGVNGEAVASGSVTIGKYSSINSNELLLNSVSRRSYSLEEDGLQYHLTFKETGKYRLSYSFRVNGKNIVLTQDVVVLSGTGEVTVSYVTDASHPFSDEIMRKAEPIYNDAQQIVGYMYKVTYSLTDNIFTLSDTSFAKTNDILFGWSMEENGSPTDNSVVLGGNGISDFIGKFNDVDPYLYAIWDGGITVNATAGSNTIKRSFYRSSNGYYEINLDQFRATPPAGYVFAGWTGGFLGDKIVTGTYRLDDIDGVSSDYFNIKAVFKKEFTVKFEIDSAYSNTVIRNETVVDGNTISTNRTPVAKDGYRFVGWYVKGDAEQTIIDLETYIVSGDITLVAVFEPITEG